MGAVDAHRASSAPAPRGLFPNGIAQGSRMFNLTGLRQALFELGAATGAGVRPFLAARWYAESGEEERGRWPRRVRAI